MPVGQQPGALPWDLWPDLWEPNWACTQNMSAPGGFMIPMNSWKQKTVNRKTLIWPLYNFTLATTQHKLTTLQTTHDEHCFLVANNKRTRFLIIKIYSPEIIFWLSVCLSFLNHGCCAFNTHPWDFKPYSIYLPNNDFHTKYPWVSTEVDSVCAIVTNIGRAIVWVSLVVYVCVCMSNLSPNRHPASSACSLWGQR